MHSLAYTRLHNADCGLQIAATITSEGSFAKLKHPAFAKKASIKIPNINELA